VCLPCELKANVSRRGFLQHAAVGAAATAIAGVGSTPVSASDAAAAPGAAVETSFDVQFTVDLIKGKKINWPRLENDTHVMSVGSTRPLIDALRLACSDLIEWLATDFGYDRIEAYQLLGQAATLKVAEVVDPEYAVACGISKRYLAGGASAPAQVPR
jgi:acetamidase/formamidase